MLEAVKQRLESTLLSLEVSHGDDVLTLDATGVHAALRMLRDEFAFEQLSDLFGMDASASGKPPEQRFCVVYSLVSISRVRRLRVKVFLPEAKPEVDSVSDLWMDANWLEREAYDMLGIVFRNHPDLRRILLPEGYDGFPLRRDYPMAGRGERDAFPKYNSRTPMGDLLKAEGSGNQSMLRGDRVREAGA